MNFVIIDVETATAKRNSICQISLLDIRSGVVFNEFTSLIMPPDNMYSEHNIRVHRIYPEHTSMAPTFDVIWPQIKLIMHGRTLLGHNIAFDVDCIGQTLLYYGISYQSNYDALCTYQATKMSLVDACLSYGIQVINHHNSLSDCYYTFELYKAIERNDDQITVNTDHTKIKSEILNSLPFENDHFFSMKTVVITGVFIKYDRNEIAEKLNSFGANINMQVTQKTDILICGSDPGFTKIERAKKFNTKILYEDDLIIWI